LIAAVQSAKALHANAGPFLFQTYPATGCRPAKAAATSATYLAIHPLHNFITACDNKNDSHLLDH
jgi:hypothetical protein